MGPKFRKQIHTALIIPAFLKDNRFKEKYSTEIKKSMDYLMIQDEWGDYVKVIAAYTFALNGNNDTANKLLSSKAKRSNSNKPTHYSLYVEIASYEILTKNLIGVDVPREAVDRLLSHRNVDGSFYSPYDTVLALKALFEYSNLNQLHSQNLNIKINLGQQEVGKIINSSMSSEAIKITNKNQKLSITGHGTTYVSVYDEIIVNPADTTDNFVIQLTKNELADNKARIHLSIKALKTTNLVVIEVELPKGYKYSGRAGDVNSPEVSQSLWL
jgi:hypothetical protein